MCTRDADCDVRLPGKALLVLRVFSPQQSEVCSPISICSIKKGVLALQSMRPSYILFSSSLEL